MGKLAKINLCYFTFYLPSRKKLPARLRRQSDQRQDQSLAITRSLNFRSVSSVSISGEAFFLQITRCPKPSSLSLLLPPGPVPRHSFRHKSTALCRPWAADK